MATKSKKPAAAKNDGSLAKGTYVWWKVHPIEVEKTRLEKDLEKLGFAEFVPNNDFRTAMIRTIRFIVRQDDFKTRRFYKWIVDGDYTAFFITLPKFVYDEVGVTDVTYHRDLNVRVHKDTGAIQFGREVGRTKVPERDADGKEVKVNGKVKMVDRPVIQWNDTSEHALAPLLADQYKKAQKYLDADQFRKILIRIVKEVYFGVSMHGGVYYVPVWASECIDTLKEIFGHFPEDVCVLRKTTVRDDDDTNEAVEDAVNEDIAARIESLVEKVMKENEDSKGQLTSKVLGNRRAEARRLMKIIELHQEDLRTRADDLSEKAKKIEQLLGNKQDKKKVDLGSALLAFKGKPAVAAAVVGA